MKSCLLRLLFGKYFSPCPQAAISLGVICSDMLQDIHNISVEHCVYNNRTIITEHSVQCTLLKHVQMSISRINTILIHFRHNIKMDSFYYRVDDITI